MDFWTAGKLLVKTPGARIARTGWTGAPRQVYEDTARDRLRVHYQVDLDGRTDHGYWPTQADMRAGDWELCIPLPPVRVTHE